MTMLNLETFFQLLQTVSIIIGIFVAIGTVRSRKNDEIGNIVEMRTDIKYIKDKISEIDSIDRRLTVVEQSLKRVES